MKALEDDHGKFELYSLPDGEPVDFWLYIYNIAYVYFCIFAFFSIVFFFCYLYSVLCISYFF